MRSIATKSLRIPVLFALLGAAACSSTPEDNGAAGSGPSDSNGSVAGKAPVAGSATAGSPSGGTPNSGGNGSGGNPSAGSPTAGAPSGGSPSAGGSAGAPSGGSGGSAAGSSGSAGAGGVPPDVCPTLPTAPIASSAITQYNDNGGWCWYQDERAVVDTKAGKFIIGSVASGGSRDGDIEATVADINGTNKKTFTLATNLSVDDHNAPAFVLRPDGKYAAMWAGHRQDCNSYYGVFDGTAWSTTKSFNWAPKGCPWDSAMTQKITYSNLWYLDGKLFSLVRSVQTSPNFLMSGDDGSAFDFYGRLSATPTTGYVAGYYKYWGNNTDRIDFVATEAHPRDADTSLWHGYVQGGKVYDSTGTKVVDDNINDANAQNIDKFTAVFKTGTTIKGVKLEHLWNHDIVRYADGSVAVLGQGRVSGTGSDDPDKRMIYSRFDGTSWKSTYLVKAGKKLYPDEQDYTGLSALHPDNPHIIFVSTPYNPTDDTALPGGKHEIFEGVTCDNGATWKWAPITQNSSVDQLRPIVPKWDSSHTLLLWLKGTYNTAQKYTLAVVGSTALSTATTTTSVP